MGANAGFGPVPLLPGSSSLPEAGSETVYDVVADGLSDVGDLLKQYHHLTSLGDAARFAELEQIQAKLELNDGWNLS